MSSTNPTPEQVRTRPARRWRPQFGLRTLLLVSLVIGAVVAKVANDARRQREIVGKVHSLGGHLFYAGGHTKPLKGNSAISIWLREQLGSEYFESIQQIDLTGTPATDDDVLMILSSTNLTSLRLERSKTTDTLLAGIGDQHRLEALDLSWTSVTDAGLAHLAQLTSIKHLQLNSDNVGDEGLTHIKKLKNLEVLGLNGTRVTGAGLDAISGHARLKSLSLSDTSVSGPGLVALGDLPLLQVLHLNGAPLNVHDMALLAKLHQLQELSLVSCRVTDEGLRQFATVRPRAKLALQLDASHVTKVGLLYLQDVPNLRSVRIVGCRLTEMELMEVRNAMPFCTFVW
jgi:hypothetical protein